MKPNTTTMTAATFVSQHVESQAGRGITLTQIAREAGYEKPNMLEMFKCGAAKIPPDRVPSLARALNADAAALFRLAILQYWTTDEGGLDAILGYPVTEAERHILNRIRALTGHQDPPLTPELDARLAAALGGLAPVVAP
jgi:hypothetical protein